MVKGS